MIVSHFELIFKPQAPGPADGVAVDRVVQGYFLSITNLEDKELRFALDFVVSPADPAEPQRSLAGNCICFYDTPPSTQPGTDNLKGVLTGAVSATVFRPSQGTIRVPPKGTAKVSVLPSIFGSQFDPTPLTSADFEVRGHVVIRLPAVFLPGPPFYLRTQPQSATPVRVLVTPQNRATFFSAANAITGQVQASLPVATGDPVLTITPEPGKPLVFDKVNLSALTDSLRSRVVDLDVGPNDVLALLLSGFEGSPPSLAALNASLKDAKIPFAIESRPPA